MARRVATALLIVLLGGGTAFADDVADGVRRARGLLDRGDTEGSIAVLRSLTEAHPNDPRPLPLLAYALFAKQDRLKEPAELLEEYLSARPADRYALDLLSQIAFRALDGGDPELARFGFRALMAAEKQVKEHRYHWAIASHRLGQRDSVRGECRRLIVDYPSFDSPYRLLAKVLIDEGRYEEAVRIYRDLSRERSGDATVWLRLGNLLLWDLRDYDSARESYRSALGIADAGSDLRAEAEAGLLRVDDEISRVKRLGDRGSFLSSLLYAALGAYAALFLLLAFLTRPLEEKRPA